MVWLTGNERDNNQPLFNQMFGRIGGSMKLLCIIPITGLRISENLGRGDKIQENLLITNDTSFFKADLKKHGVDYQHNTAALSVLNAPMVVYFIINDPSNDGMESYISEVNHAIGFLNSLWFSRDNSISFESIVVASFLGGILTLHESQFVYRSKSCYEGQSEEVLNREGLRSSRSKYLDLLEAGYRFDIRDMNLSEEMPQMTRAVSWLITAREQESHLVKLLHYITCFESIFTTFTDDIAESLAERIYSFLESSERRQEVFQTIRRAYTIRSTIVHGKPLDEKTYQKSIKIVQSLDEYLRLTFNELWSDPKLWERIN